MRIEPLKQWICDTCGELISCPEDGFLEIGHGADGAITDMRIVHHMKSSPRGNCYKGYSGTIQLNHLIGEHGIVQLLSLLDPGEDFCDYRPRVENVRKYAEIFRRLSVPYYEEARLYWDEAKADGFFDGANEVWTFLPEHLKELCETYR